MARNSPRRLSRAAFGNPAAALGATTSSRLLGWNRHGEASPSLVPSAFEHITAPGCRHPAAKAVCPFPPDVAGLVRTLHRAERFARGMSPQMICDVNFELGPATPASGPYDRRPPPSLSSRRLGCPFGLLRGCRATFRTLALLRLPMGRTEVFGTETAACAGFRTARRVAARVPGLRKLSPPPGPVVPIAVALAANVLAAAFVFTGPFVSHLHRLQISPTTPAPPDHPPRPAEATLLPTVGCPRGPPPLL